MLYEDLVDLIGVLPEGYEWIYGLASAFVLCMYVYTFIRIFFGMFNHTTRGRY